jgi:hypothetical protein
VIEPIYGKREDLRVVYDTKLYKGGSITGWAVEEPSDIKLIADALANMNPRSGIRAAVGDGNHSLAAAKQSWESVKADLSEDEIETHLARFAMVEVCNIFDDGITFEPIHRIVMGVAASSMMIAFFAWLKEQGAKPAVVIGDKVDSKSVSADLQTIGLIGVSGAYTIVVENPPRLLAVDTLQTFLDEWGQSGAKVDYIHGGDTLRRLAAEPNRAGFILPPVDKAGLFSSVAKYGALPRKTFSMGEASEKRYYLECRKITSYTP